MDVYAVRRVSITISRLVTRPPKSGRIMWSSWKPPLVTSAQLHQHPPAVLNTFPFQYVQGKVVRVHVHAVRHLVDPCSAAELPRRRQRYVKNKIEYHPRPTCPRGIPAYMLPQAES